MASFDSQAAASLTNMPADVGYIRTAGYSTAGDGGEAFYKRAAVQSAGAGKFQTADGAWWELAEPVIYSPMVGARGNGTTDDTARLRDAFSIGAGTVDGYKRTYKVVADESAAPAGYTAALALKSDTTYRNMKFDFSASPQGGMCLIARGTEGAAISCTSGVAKSGMSVSVASTSGLVVGMKVRISTNELWGNWSSTATEKRGEIKEIESFSGTTVNFTEPAYDTYAPSNGLALVPLTMLKNVRFENCEFIGGGDGKDQKLAWLEYIDGLWIEGCRSDNISFWHWDIRGCLDVHINECTLSRADSDQALGFNYGIVLSGACQDVTVGNNTFRRFRHGVTVGGSYGVSRRIAINSNSFREMLDAGVDTHPAADMYTIANNTISIRGSGGAANSRDGIMMQGANATCTGNVVEGFNGVGICAQLMANAYDDCNVIGNNRITTNETGAIGILVDHYKQTANVNQISLPGNTVRCVGSATRGLLVQSKIGTGDIQSISVSGGGYDVTQTPIAFDGGGGNIVDIAVTGVNARSFDTTAHYGILGTGKIGQAAVAGSTIVGGWKGISFPAGKLIQAGNAFRNQGAGGTV